MSEPDLSSAISQLADSLQQLSLAVRASPSLSPSGPSGSSGGWILVGPETPVEPGSREASGPHFAVHHSRLSAAQLTNRYNELEATFAPLPEHCLRACRALVGSGATLEQRASRAWVAGLWAKLVLSDCVPTPRPSIRLPSSLRPRFYIVLRCSRFEGPRLFSSGRSFKEAVGALEDSGTVCHSFASVSEVEVYCDAAGFAVPPLQ